MAPLRVRLTMTMAALAATAAALVMLPAASVPTPNVEAQRIQAQAAYGHLPLRFDANDGQTNRQVDFLARGAGYSLFLTPRESVITLSKPASPGSKTTDAHRATLRMQLTGADVHATATGIQRLAGHTNYLRGSDPKAWRTGVSSYAKVRYASVYPGIDLLYHGTQGKLEYDFHVAAGADPGRIALRFSGASGIRVDRAGNLSLQTVAGTVRHERPRAYQVVRGAQHAVPARFVLREGNRITFSLGSYDHGRPLVIDPIVVYSTYLGGGIADTARSIAVDASGNAYITGSTESSNFPTANALRGGPVSGSTDTFVTKLNPTGSALIYSTYLGGTSDDTGIGIAADSAGNAYVAGSTRSTDFPTQNALQPSFAGFFFDGFVSKLNPTGSAFVYSTYLGGTTGVDVANAIAVDGSGAAYIAGETGSTDFPTQSAAQPAYGGGDRDAFVTKIAPAGTSLAYSTYLGGSGTNETGLDVAVSTAGNAYVTGDTASPNFPTTGGAWDTTCGATGTCDGGPDAFVTKLSTTGSTLDYSTFLGGAGYDEGLAIGLGRGAEAGRAYVTGVGETGFPTTPGVFDTTAGTFVSKLNDNGSALDYSTIIGAGTRHAGDAGSGIAVDSAGAAYVAGTTASTTFPADVRPVATPGPNGIAQAFVTKVKNDGTGLVWYTRLGGNFQTLGSDLALDNADAAYVTGTASAPDFPTQNALQPHNASQASRGNAKDAFVAKLARDDPAAPYINAVTPEGDDTAGGRPVKISGTGLTNVSSVKFGGVEATRFDILSSTEIVAISPPHGEADARVTVTSPAGSSPPNPATRFVYGEGRWSDTDPLPRTLRLNARRPTATLLPTGRVLIAGGGSTDAELYDPKTGSFTKTGSLNEERSFHTATLLRNGKVLVRSDASAELYDPATGTWSVVTPAPTEFRSGHTATLLPSGKVLIAGGTTAELYDPATNTFSTAAAPPRRLSAHTATLLPGGNVLMAGGAGAFPNSSDAAELYDPANDTWTETGKLNIGRQAASATLLPNGKVLVAGGSAGFSLLLNTAELYDPANGTWTLSILGEPRQGHAAVLLANGKVLVVAGQSLGEKGLATAELFDPALKSGQGAWKPAGVTNVRTLNAPTATALSSDPDRFASDPTICATNCGKVLVVGSTYSTDAELYTPSNPPATPAAVPTSAAAPTPANPLPDNPAPSSGGKTITGTTGNDRLVGTPGNDVIRCGAGDDVVIAGAGDDVIDCGPGNDRIAAGAGDDRVFGGSGNDRIIGGPGNDRLSGNSGHDQLAGGSGKDHLSGGSGNDRLAGGAGNDHAHGNAGRDRVDGNDGNDVLIGSTGNDTIRGGRGADRLSGGPGEDQLIGGPGKDVLRGGPGKNRLRQ